MTAANGARADFLAGGGEMGRRIEAFDWTLTPLGPLERWPQSLKTSVSLILSSRHPIWVGWGPEMTFLYNDAYVRVLGRARHPGALGQPAARVLAEIWDVCGPLADKAFRNAEATFVDDVRLFVDRGDSLEETFYSFSCSPIRDETGEVSGLFCPSTDVTPRVVNARRLRTLSELATNALAERTTADACAVMAHTLARNRDDVPFALLYMADAEGLARLEQAVGEFGNDALKSDRSLWRIREVLEKCRREIVPTSGLAGLPSGPAGQPIREAVVLPVARGEHTPWGVLVVGVNPSRPLDAEHLTFFELLAAQVGTAIQNVRAVEEEKRYADMLAEVDRARTVFFSNVSQEFRTPLTLMLGPLESLLAHPENLRPEDHEHLEIAHRNSLRLLRLVNSLLDFSRIEAGRARAVYAPVDLAQLTAGLASSFRSAMKAAGLEFVVECEKLPEDVYVDQEMWEKVVLNLLSNALKFTLEGRVTLRLKAVGGEAMLTVSDTGTGIPEAELPLIFERFHRIEDARGRTYEGTGIGLALIHELVKLHSGAVSVESRLGEGSTFTVQIPFGTNHLPPGHIGKHAAEKTASAVRADLYTGEALTWLASSSHNAAKTGAASERPIILLADDNADMREHVSRILGRDYELITASDGEQALKLIRQRRPDVVLTDIMMPRLDGLGLLKALRSEPATETLPVIFITARAGEEMRVEGLDAGADDYLTKPFGAGELRARVATQLKMTVARQRATQREASARAEAETLNQVSRTLASELDLENVIRAATDAGRKLAGAKTGAYDASFRGEEPVRRDDHLAIPVISRSGEVLGGFIFEHPAAGAFSDRAERMAAGIAGHAAVAIDNARLFAQRMQAEEALRRSEEQFRGVFQSSAIGVAITALDMRFLAANKAFCAITGYTEEELKALDCTRLTHPADRAELDRLVAQLMRGDIPTFAFEKRYVTKSGRTIWVQNSVSVMRDAQGRPEHLIALSEDITSRREMEDALRESEERYRAIVETTPECVKVVSREGTLLHMNSSGLAMVGAEALEDVVGGSVYDLIAPEFREEYRQFNERICGGEKGSLQFDITGLRGPLRHMETHAVPLRRPDGETVQLAITRDVTRRRRGERAMLLLGAIVDSSDDAIVSKDLNGIITSWNKGAESLFGYTAAEVIGKSITILIPEDRLSEEPKILGRLQRGERVEHFETIRRRKDGALLNISLTISPVKDAQGKIIGASKIARDITQQKRAEEAIRTLNAQLTADLAAMRRMQQLSTRLVQAGDFPLLLGEIIEAATEITRADMGRIDLFEGSAAKLVSQRGFESLPDASELLESGGPVLPRDERTVVEEIPDGPLASAGVRAMQATPLVSRSGQVLGTFSTYYRSPVRPGERELRMLDVLGRQAADLVERMSAEEALRGSEARFRQLAEIGPQFIWVSGADGSLEYVNQRWIEYSGIDLTGADLRRVTAAIHPEDLPELTRRWEQSLRTGETFETEARLRRADAVFRWFVIRGVPLRDDAGRIVKWFGASTDIDEQKRVEEELRSANRDLEQFAFSASHDLQEPLRGVKIYSELLSRRYAGKFDGEALEFLGFLRESASRMEQLVRDLLAYTQVTRLEPPEETVDANRALADTLANLNGAILESGARVTSDPLPRPRVNDTHLRQLFQNLLGNAIKYRSAGRSPVVHVRAEMRDRWCVFSVSDNGIGIEPQYKERIFGLFKRLHTGDEYSGTGIGLAICKRIVERYQGRIWVESEAGQGSRFYFSLPR